MIVIVVKWSIKDEFVEQWPGLVAEFTEATRAEKGNLWFEWSRSLEEPNTYVLVEAFADGAAEAHVTAPHFKKAMSELGLFVTERPRVVSVEAPGDDWSELGELDMPPEA